jgi:hypothetical protein
MPSNPPRRAPEQTSGTAESQYARLLLLQEGSLRPSDAVASNGRTAKGARGWRILRQRAAHTQLRTGVCHPAVLEAGAGW